MERKASFLQLGFFVPHCFVSLEVEEIFRKQATLLRIQQPQRNWQRQQLRNNGKYHSTKSIENRARVVVDLRPFSSATIVFALIFPSHLSSVHLTSLVSFLWHSLLRLGPFGLCSSNNSSSNIPGRTLESSFVSMKWREKRTLLVTSCLRTEM